MNPPDAERGKRIRQAIARTVLPRLRVGEQLPPHAAIARALGVAVPTASKHVRIVLAEAGVVTRRDGRLNGRVVVEMRSE